MCGISRPAIRTVFVHNVFIMFRGMGAKKPYCVIRFCGMEDVNSWQHCSVEKKSSIAMDNGIIV